MSEPKTLAAGRSRVNARGIAVTAMLSVIGFVLMFLEFAIPVIIPNFVKMDISELPALLAAFSLGPVYGAAVCGVKNLLHLLVTTSGGVGELGNFLMGVCLVVPAGLIYKKIKTRKGAIISAVVGSIVMAVMSIPINYFITYPFYSNFMPLDVIIGMYQAIRPSANGLLECLITFNMPFTLLKGVITSFFCFLLYKPLSPLLHGRKA